MRMEKATEIVMAQELFEQGLGKSAIARRLGRDRETIRFWLRGVEQARPPGVYRQPSRRM